jgi:hypothetical protein
MRIEWQHISLDGGLLHVQLRQLSHQEQNVRIGEFVFVDDPGAVLRMLEESGLFEIVSPNGDAYHLTCQTGTVTKSEGRGNHPAHQQHNLKWYMRKLDDLKVSKSPFAQY